MTLLPLSHDYMTTRVQLQAKDKPPRPPGNPSSHPQGIRRPREKGGGGGEGEGWLFSSVSHPLSFPSNKFSSLCLNTQLLFFSVLVLR